MATVGIGKRFLSLSEASEYASLSIQTLRRAIASGRLQAHRPDGTRSVRIDVLDLSRFMAGWESAGSA